ncbi:hypothetical protein OHA72_06850 [Dactylosporangium sp. NBC_01737]|uniref:hypothetical protein n=1 Tax=Dactylosporangium sp. NBC_01737 TaxID=2975959 RepID=UPI002E0FF183|nr:hypothetical protein OHA72_06850 [Dactylosporangium sp. NBC_01737]
MSEWEPATEAEGAMRDALRANDQEQYFRILARVDILLPIAPEGVQNGDSGWGTWTTEGRTHVLAFTSPEALRECLAGHPGTHRRVPFRDLTSIWPNVEWWLAVNPGLPIEGYLPSWFVTQITRGDVRLPGRTLGARARIEQAAGSRARATAQVPVRSVPNQPAPSPIERHRMKAESAPPAPTSAPPSPTSAPPAPTSAPPLGQPGARTGGFSAAGRPLSGPSGPPPKRDVPPPDVAPPGAFLPTRADRPINYERTTGAAGYERPADFRRPRPPATPVPPAAAAPPAAPGRPGLFDESDRSSLDVPGERELFGDLKPDVPGRSPGWSPGADTRPAPPSKPGGAGLPMRPTSPAPGSSGLPARPGAGEFGPSGLPTRPGAAGPGSAGPGSSGPGSSGPGSSGLGSSGLGSSGLGSSGLGSSGLGSSGLGSSGLGSSGLPSRPSAGDAGSSGLPGRPGAADFGASGLPSRPGDAGSSGLPMRPTSPAPGSGGLPMRPTSPAADSSGLPARPPSTGGLGGALPSRGAAGADGPEQDDRDGDPRRYWPRREPARSLGEIFTEHADPVIPAAWQPPPVVPLSTAPPLPTRQPGDRPDAAFRPGEGGALPSRPGAGDQGALPPRAGDHGSLPSRPGPGDQGSFPSRRPGGGDPGSLPSRPAAGGPGALPGRPSNLVSRPSEPLPPRVEPSDAGVLPVRPGLVDPGAFGPGESGRPESREGGFLQPGPSGFLAAGRARAGEPATFRGDDPVSGAGDPSSRPGDPSSRPGDPGSRPGDLGSRPGDQSGFLSTPGDPTPRGDLTSRGDFASRGDAVRGEVMGRGEVAARSDVAGRGDVASRGEAFGGARGEEPPWRTQGEPPLPFDRPGFSRLDIEAPEVDEPPAASVEAPVNEPGSLFGPVKGRAKAAGFGRVPDLDEHPFFADSEPSEFDGAGRLFGQPEQPLREQAPWGPSAFEQGGRDQAAPDAAAEQAARELAAREQAARDQAAQDAREQAAREQAAQDAREQAAREQAAQDAREQAAREQAAQEARDQAARDEARRLAEQEAAREAAREIAAQQAAREAAQELAAQEAARDLAAQEAARELAAQDAAREVAAQEAARELAEREAAREQAEREAAQEAAQQAAQERAAREQELADQQARDLAAQKADAERAASDRAELERDRAALDRAAEQRAALSWLAQEQDAGSGLAGGQAAYEPWRPSEGSAGLDLAAELRAIEERAAQAKAAEEVAARELAEQLRAIEERVARSSTTGESGSRTYATDEAAQAGSRAEPWSATQGDQPADRHDTESTQAIGRPAADRGAPVSFFGGADGGTPAENATAAAPSQDVRSFFESVYEPEVVNEAPVRLHAEIVDAEVVTPAVTVPVKSAAAQARDFRPANTVEQDLFEAVQANSTDRFLSTLLLAKILVPEWSGEGPIDPASWRTEHMNGLPHLVVFTAAERLADRLGADAQGSWIKFTRLIRNWPPGDQLAFAVNPDSPIGAVLPGTEVVQLATWAAELGLGVDEPEAPTAAATPAQQPRPTFEPQVSSGPLLMQKPISPEQLSYYLERGYDRVSGFVHRAGEVGHLQTPEQLYQALGLGYAGSSFKPDAEEAYVLRWKAYRGDLYRIPYGGPHEAAMRAMEGWVIERPPFRGNGFAPSDTSDVIAEFKVDSARLPHHAELWRLRRDGQQELIARLDADGPAWRKGKEL